VRARLILSFVGVVLVSWFVSAIALHAILVLELEAARARFEQERATGRLTQWPPHRSEDAQADDPAQATSRGPAARAVEYGTGTRDGEPSGAQGTDGPPPGGFGPPPPRGRHGPPPWWGLFERLGLVRALTRVAISIAPALLLGSRFVKRIRELGEGARAFRSTDFGHRVPVRGNDELDEVANTMNSMADTVAAHIAATEEDARRKQQLLADIAHELRSPVATLRTMSEALRDGLAEDPERRQSAVTAIASSAERLQRLVDDSLTLARRGLDQLPLHPERFDLNAVAIEAVERHRHSADAAGVTLHAPERSDPLWVEADRHRVDQILDNLLTNAIDHTGPGTEARVAVSGSETVRVSVSDTGPGVPPEDLPYLGEPVYRRDASRTPGSEHVGLGVGLATGLARLHGGDLTIESEPGRGTVVTVRLPNSRTSPPGLPSPND